VDELKPGRYKARAVRGSEQYGEAGDNATPQIAIDMQVPSLNRTLTTFLFFSSAAAPYSYERLRALGWEDSQGLENLAAIDRNEVEVNVTTETYQGKLQVRCDIATGNGKVTLQKTVDKKSFAARVKAITGSGGAAPPLPVGGGKDPWDQM